MISACPLAGSKGYTEIATSPPLNSICAIEKELRVWLLLHDKSSDSSHLHWRIWILPSISTISTNLLLVLKGVFEVSSFLMCLLSGTCQCKALRQLQPLNIFFTHYRLSDGIRPAGLYS